MDVAVVVVWHGSGGSIVAMSCSCITFAVITRNTTTITTNLIWKQDPKRRKLQEERSESLNPEEQRQLAEKMKRKHDRHLRRCELQIEKFQEESNKIRDELCKDICTKIRYEPRKHQTLAWSKPIHQLMARWKTSAKKWESKSYRFEVEDMMDLEAFKDIVKKKL